MLAVFTVDNVADTGAGSLRDAIDSANALPGADSVEFIASLDGQTIFVNSELVVTEAVLIDASSFAAGLTIDASAADATPGVEDGMGIRILRIDDGDSSTLQTVTIDGLTLRGGDVTGSGGAIEAMEHVELSNSTITGNHATVASAKTAGITAWCQF